LIGASSIRKEGRAKVLGTACYTDDKFMPDALHGATVRSQVPRGMLKDIRRECDLTRKRGYSLDDEEFNLGVRCLAAPVFASDGSVAAAIGVTAATVRFTKERIPEIAVAVRDAATELSRLLGYDAPSA